MKQKPCKKGFAHKRAGEQLKKNPASSVLLVINVHAQFDQTELLEGVLVRTWRRLRCTC